MADLRVDADRDARPGGAGGGSPRGRLRVVVALVLVAGVVVFAALMGGGALMSRPAASEAASRPSVEVSATVTAGAVPSVSPSAVAPSGAAPSSSPSSLATARIAIVDDSGSLVTLDERGGSQVSYPTHGLALGFPAWSPDGTRVAVVGQGAEDTAIYVYTVDRTAGVGDEPTVVYRSADHPPFYLYWTPDSRHVSFLTSEAVGLALRVAPVDRSTPLDEKDVAAVIRRGAPLYFDWVDTDRVLLHVGGGSDAFTGQVDLLGAAVGSPIDATGSFRTASLSRDGRYLAYARSATGATGEIVLETTTASTSQRIPAFGPAAMLFDPTSDTLATIAADKPVTQALGFPFGPLRLIDPASGASRTLLDRSSLAFFWAPDGRTIAALHVIGPDQAPVAAVGRLVLAGADDSGPQAGGGGDSVGSNVGLVFVDVSTGAVRSERVVRLADAFVGQLLPYFDQYALSHQLWSPDSASVLLPLVAPSGKDQLVVIPVDGSDPRQIADGAKGFWSP